MLEPLIFNLLLFRSFYSSRNSSMRKSKKTNELRKILTHWKWQMMHSVKKYVY